MLLPDVNQASGVTRDVIAGMPIVTATHMRASDISDVLLGCLGIASPVAGKDALVQLAGIFLLPGLLKLPNDDKKLPRAEKRQVVCFCFVIFLKWPSVIPTFASRSRVGGRMCHEMLVAIRNGASGTASGDSTRHARRLPFLRHRTSALQGRTAIQPIVLRRASPPLTRVMRQLRG
ncbi:uncharacterized protein CIMG_07047 [Coccidioides immitis RS]|uniref:Uncharacterized protein n=1 Tax=Coccidioides immitis (strain RS) TaxID=246410 RepID=J3K9I4_COCIM|nr:uncharacterized protein CIMG_07047 [Coccidioides immitis RS]EAS31568.3 hypothetical protein CIMG_07047 [Coccidioides immitis RS]